MIVLVDSLTGITRLEHALIRLDGTLKDSRVDFVVSLEPVVRDRAYELGWDVYPTIYAGHRGFDRRRSALRKLAGVKDRLLLNRWISKFSTRHFVALHVLYRSIQTQLMSDATTNLDRYERAIRDCLKDADANVSVAVYGSVSLLIIANLGLAPERVHIL